MSRKCLYCNDPIDGRVDKKFCTASCKSCYNYNQKKENTNTVFLRVMNQLKLNRKILKQVTSPGASQVNKEILINKGFSEMVYTHTWTAANGNVYKFCFEYGYRILPDSQGGKKYMLIHWQDYMN